MSLKPIWKERAETKALARAAEPKLVDAFGPSPLAGFRPLSFQEIRDRLVTEFKLQMPHCSHAIDDPTSNFGQFINAIAAADVDLYKQVEAAVKFIEEKGVKLK